MSLSQIFERTVSDVAHDPSFSGIEFVSQSARRQAGTTVLHVMIDREGGVDLKLCEQVASAVNARLEPAGETYTLEVESAGLNRPLTKAGDYERFSGRTVKVVTTLLIEGGKTHRGVLGGVQGTNVILHTGTGRLPLPLAVIKSANLEYDIRTDLKREKKERKSHA